jgi:phosphoglycolate phosphatase
MLNSLDAILFDLDGVIVDSRAPVARCINFALERAGLRPESEPRLHARIGDPLHGVFVELLAERGEGAARAPECVASYRELYRDVSLAETSLVPGMRKLLADLAGRRPLALATSKPLEFAMPILERLGVAAHFAAHVGAPLVAGEPESKTGTARRALAALGLAPGARAALDGDRHHDVSAARTLAIRSIGVTWGIGSEAELREAGADLVVHSPDELGRLLA